MQESKIEHKTDTGLGMLSTGSAAIALSNPKSPSNVAAVMRAAGCYGANTIYYNGNRYNKAREYNKCAEDFRQDTKKAQEKIPLINTESFIDLKQKHQNLVCVELVEGAIPLPEFKHPEHAVYIFGPEDASIDKSIIAAADAVVYIPTIGCMNLAATVNVLLYDRMAKTHKNLDHNALIRQSRDVNNSLKVHDTLENPPKKVTP